MLYTELSLTLGPLNAHSRYFLDYDFESRYHWFRTVNMVVMIVLVWSDTWLKAPLGVSAAAVGQAQMARSLMQVFAVMAYLALLCVLKPYVKSRLRHWKQYVD